MRVIRRVLVVQPYGIGDLLFLTPVFRALRLLPGIERVDLILGSRTESVVSENPHVDEITVIDRDLFHRRSRKENLSEVVSLGKKLRARRYDLLLDYSMRSEYGFWGLLFLGIPVRAGFSYKRRGIFHNRKVPIPQGFTGKHVADFACDLAEAAGVPVEDRWLEFYLSKEEAASADKKIKASHSLFERPYAVIAPGGGESWGKDAHFKRWPASNFAELALMSKDRLSFEGVAVIGSPAEKTLCAELMDSLELPSVNLAGKLSLKESVRVIEGADLFLGNDGGLFHIACARRRPAVGLYGPVDPKVYGPFLKTAWSNAVVKEGLECRPCYKKFRYKSDCAHRDCLQALSPREVFARLNSDSFFEAARDRVSSPGTGAINANP